MTEKNIVTIEDLLGHAKEKSAGETFYVYLTELDKQVECRTISRREYLDILTSKEEDKDSEVIYNSCKIFRDERLSRDLKCQTNPVEVVGKVLNYSTILSLTEIILGKSELDSTNSKKYAELIERDIKN